MAGEWQVCCACELCTDLASNGMSSDSSCHRNAKFVQRRTVASDGVDVLDIVEPPYRGNKLCAHVWRQDASLTHLERQAWNNSIVHLHIKHQSTVSLCLAPEQEERDHAVL